MELTLIEHNKQEIDYMRGLCAIASRTGQYGQLTPDMMLNIMLTAKDYGISPMKALNGGFFIVNGKIGMSTALMVDRIRRDGHSISVKMGDDRCEVTGKRKDNGDTVTIVFTMDDAQRAGLAKSQMYQKYPKVMCYNRAMSMLARVLFADVVGQCYSEDEGMEIKGVPPEKWHAEEPKALETQPAEVIESEPTSPVLELVARIEAEDVTGVEAFLQHQAAKHNVDIDEVLATALKSEALTQRFKTAYNAFVASRVAV